MKILKTTYAYLFFFLYNSINKKDNILIQTKALFIMVLLEFFLMFSMFVQYGNITKTTVLPEDFNAIYLLFVILPIVLLKMWFFERNKNWKRYIEEFNEWSLNKRKRWDWIMRIIVVAVLGNVILSFYCMSQIDWN